MYSTPELHVLRQQYAEANAQCMWLQSIVGTPEWNKWYLRACDLNEKIDDLYAALTLVYRDHETGERLASVWLERNLDEMNDPLRWGYHVVGKLPHYEATAERAEFKVLAALDGAIPVKRSPREITLRKNAFAARP